MIKRLLFGFFFLLVGILIGGNFVYSKHWPYFFLRELGVGAIVPNKDLDDNEGFFRELFPDDLVARDRLLPNVSDRASLISAINAMSAPRIDIRGVADDVRLVGSLTSLELPREGLNLVSIRYDLDDFILKAYAYKLEAIDMPALPGSSCATLVIPGSGHDQALAIAHRDPQNYHAGILKPFSDCDVFVLIKPNEDYLSITHNEKKLTEKAYINHLIGIGSSYSSRYVTDAIALTLALKRQYSRTIVTGLSQGGAASILVGIEARPSLSIVASGFFEIVQDIGYGGYNSSLVFPGLQPAIFKNWLPKKLHETDVDFLVIAGSNETGLAGQDVREGWTCSKLAAMPHVNCISHSGGHIYPSEAVKAYLGRHAYSARQVR